MRAEVGLSGYADALQSRLAQSADCAGTADRRISQAELALTTCKPERGAIGACKADEGMRRACSPSRSAMQADKT